ncbi:hypothetical protein [Mesorhizobium sp. M7A.F.Ca.CA.002.12.1.1]|uniref:hypothetical protein n=1 Tax=Mesorhizobium sp. M7A.F.Ca.CA.002.12.1.1 TaxID=2496735 RepID=UPI0013DFDD48|nr:hypothetical protein [Mesorhizobium sp. M7A.F.Ca.CA.002.12.1.1]
MRNDRPNYKPGFAEHKIPVPMAWFDKVAIWAIIALALVIDVAALLSLGWVP